MSSEKEYRKKYLKYKQKYQNLQSQIGGGIDSESSRELPPPQRLPPPGIIPSTSEEELKRTLKSLLQRRIEITIKFKTLNYEGRFKPINGHDFIDLFLGNVPDNVISKLTIDDIIIYRATEQLKISILQKMADIDEEILIVAKKANFFKADSHLLTNLEKYMDQSNPVYNDLREQLLKLDDM